MLLHLERSRYQYLKKIILCYNQINMKPNQKNILIVVILGIILIAVVGYKLAIQKTEQQVNNLRSQPTTQEVVTTEGITTNTKSQSQRTEITIYSVQPGDTVDSVAKKFGISTQTIMWANNLTSPTLTSEQKLQILPVTGVAHKVVSGDTVESLATKYHTDQEKIINFPGNNFSNPQKHSLIVGETLIIPDGRM